MSEFSLTDYAIPGFIALLVLEAVVAARRRARVFRNKDTATSLAMGMGNVVVNLGWKGVAFAIYTQLHAFALFDIGTGWVAWVAVIFADDFCYYWFHRLHHEVRFFWASHVTHHSSRQYNLSTALRQSWTTPFTGIWFYMPLAIIGFDPVMMMTASSINLIYQFWIHTRMIDRLGAFEWVFNTPSHHRVHHGANVEYLDRNYAGIFIIWDRLFGTFEPEVAPVNYGLTKNIESYNPVYVAFHEWVAMFRDAFRAPSWRTALAYLWEPPGWSPDGSTKTAPQLKADAGLGPVTAMELRQAQ